MAKVIAEKALDGHTVQMVINANDTISVSCKKQPGRRRDDSHDVDEFYLVNPGMAELLRGVTSPHNEATLPWLASFIAQMWNEAAEYDPWYFQEEVFEPELAEA